MKHLLRVSMALVVWAAASATSAQTVCLPAPRLLTTMPMGGQAGTTVEITITGEHLDDANELYFSHPGLTATRKLDDKGQPVANTYVVSIATDCPVGVYEARVMTRLGLSSARAFNVGTLTEVVRQKPNNSLDSALPLPVDSICNAATTRQGVDYYSFDAIQGQRYVIECAARGIDSKLKPVLSVADEQGADLVVERHAGELNFTAGASGKYVVKTHDLTYNGGPQHFYRLALRQAAANESLARLPSVQMVNAFSWPPAGLSDAPLQAEVEPNDRHSEAQKITLPCDITGNFFPAADVDTYEFSAKQGEVWWVEVASERLGRPTDPAIVVQHVRAAESGEMLTDIAELNDIPSPVRVSSNGYSYDGPPYDAGTADVLGKFEIKEDGIYRLQINDLFGGTRNDPRNVYRLVIRRAAPDFALVGWAVHMELRNGDRNALSKPIALRGGATMAIEVIAIRRDGFDGEIEMFMENLPQGVSATGLKIPAGKSRGIMLVTADEDAPRGFSNASFYGRANIDGNAVTRPCRLASMQWPIPDASQEIPSPRLLADIPVSVNGTELFPISIHPAEDKWWEVAAGEKLTIPLQHTLRSEFSGGTISLRTYGAGFEQMPAFTASLTATSSTANLDLAALKTPPGDYVIAFYGSAVAKYRSNKDAPPKDTVDIVISTPVRIRVLPKLTAR